MGTPAQPTETIDDKIKDLERIEAESKATYNKLFAELDASKANAFNVIADAESKVKSLESIIKAQSMLPSTNGGAQLRAFQTQLDVEKKRIVDHNNLIEYIDTVQRPQLLDERQVLLTKFTAEKQRLQKLKNNASKNPSTGGQGTNGGGSGSSGGGTSGGTKINANAEQGGLQWWAWALIGFAILIVLVLIVVAISSMMKKKKRQEEAAPTCKRDECLFGARRRPRARTPLSRLRQPT